MINAQYALRASLRTFAAVGVFSFAINLLMLSVPLYTLNLFDRVLTSQSMETLWLLSFAAFAALVFLGVLEILRSRIMVRISVWLDQLLGPVLMRHGIQRTPLSHDNGHMESLRDLSTLRSFVSGNGAFQFFDAPWVPIYVLVIFLMHPLLGLLALVGAGLLCGIALLNEAATRRPLAEAGKHAIDVQANVESSARNAEAVESMGMLQHIESRWTQGNAQVLTLQTVASDRAGLLAGITKTLRLGIQVAVMGVGVYLAVHKQITPGVMIAASIILGRALAPVEQMIGTWRGFVAARESFHRINEVLAHPVGRRTATNLPEPVGHLSVDEVTCIPPGAQVPSVYALSFDLKPGEALGIIGPSAAGKSSLARMMVGVWQPRSGHIRLDDADTYLWNRDDFGKYVGYLPQDVELFRGTIKENIARMATEISDADVIHAAQRAGCHQLILKLPQGYDTEIGPAGVTLSAGQRQRIALARALYGGVKFLVLDEPNANLDDEGDRALMNALRRVREEGITTIIVSHRPSVLSTVDKLLLMRDGRMVAFGSRDDVLDAVKSSNVTPLRRPAPQRRVKVS